MSSGPGVSAAFAAVLIDEWVRAGVTDAVVAPGSRSTPLIAALAADGRLRVHLVLDERSGGFMALGIGLATGRPAPVITTSGTAAVELHPSVVEADQAGVALIAVTADRPPELHDVGAPQTVTQEGVFGSSPRWAVSPGVADTDAVTAWRSVASRTVAVASGAGGRPGPVHLNLAFREPLLAAPVEVPPGRAAGAPWHRVVPLGATPPAPETVDLLIAHQGGRGLLVAGAGAGEPAALQAMADRLGWPVLADPRSGVGRGVAAADALLRVPAVAAMIPSIVVRLGRPWASKVLNTWLDELPATVVQVLVDPQGSWVDPGRRAGLIEGASPTALAAAVLAGAGPGSDGPGAWCLQWAGVEAAAQAAIDAALAAETELNEPALARRLMAEAAPGAVLLCSSSMPVRDIEWWSQSRPDVTVLANRGANGIDGVISTALGVAVGSGRPTVALVGDLAFLYDASALLWARDRPVDLTVVVADNNGGGIFSFLSQAAAFDAATFERYWGTPHGLDLAAVAAAYGVEVVRIDDLDGLPGALRAGPGVGVVVVTTNRDTNVAVHRRLHAAVAGGVAGYTSSG